MRQGVIADFAPAKKGGASAGGALTHARCIYCPIEGSAQPRRRQIRPRLIELISQAFAIRQGGRRAQGLYGTFASVVNLPGNIHNCATITIEPS